MTIPLPPSTNNLFVNKATGGRVKSKYYRDWHRKAGWALAAQRGKWPPVTGKWGLKIRLPHHYAPDIDNSAKAVIDLIVVMKLAPDDKELLELHITKDATGADCLVSAFSIAPLAKQEAA